MYAANNSRSNVSFSRLVSVRFMAYQHYKSYIFEVELQSLHVQDHGEELDVVGYLRMNLIHELYPVQFS